MEEVDAQFIILNSRSLRPLWDALSIALKNDATIIAVNELATYVSKKGAKAHFMHIVEAGIFLLEK
jgi:hypothetical protein